MRFLETKDSFERNLMQTIAVAAREQEIKFDEHRAVQIANSVGKMLAG